MPVTFKIPTIFSAIDKFNPTLQKMQDGVATFANRAEASVSRVDRVFRKATPVLGETSKQLLSMASAAAVAGAAIGGIRFSVQSMENYENAVASFRTIVSDVSDKDFEKYKDAINEVAKTTKKSTIDVAASFEKIAGLNATFAKTPESIKAVSAAAITLSKASGEELEPSAYSLVGIMNQFGFEADQASRTINVLAAGAGVGAASIAQTAEAFVNFGSVAKGANITLEQSVGLIQTMGKFSLFGAEAGTKLRGSILKLQQSGIGYKSGQFQINDALEEANQKISKLKTAKQKDLAILKIFGAENISTGKILLENIKQFKDYTAGVTGTNAAQEQAAIRSKTFSNTINELKAAFINYITTSPQATDAMTKLGNAARWIGEHLSEIIHYGWLVIKWILIFKALILISRGVLLVYNIALGITTALTGASSIAMRGNTVALAAQKIALGLATAAQWALNAAMTANPIGLIIVGIAALITWVTVVIRKWNEWGAALAMTVPVFGILISVIQSVRRNWDRIVRAFKDNGIIAGLKAIGSTIVDAILMPLQQVLKLASKLPDWLGGGLAGKGAEKIAEFREKLGVNTTTDESGNQLEKPALNPKDTEQRALIQKMQTTNNAKVGIDLNLPFGMDAAVRNKSSFVTINTGTTMPGYNNK